MVVTLVMYREPSSPKSWSAAKKCQEETSEGSGKKRREWLSCEDEKGLVPVSAEYRRTLAESGGAEQQGARDEKQVSDARRKRGP